MSGRLIVVTLTLAFLLLIIIVAAVGGLGLGETARLHTEAQDIAATEWQDVQLANESLDYSNQNSNITMEIVMSDDPSEIDSLVARRAANDARISALIELLKGRIGSKEEGRLLQAVIDARSAYLESSQHATDILLKQKNPAEAKRALSRTTAPLLAKYHVTWSNFIRFQTDEMNNRLDKNAADYAVDRKRTRLLIIAGVLLAVAIALYEIQKTLAEIRGRTRAENSQQAKNADLERSLLQRTAALEKSNQKLVAEIAQRRQVEENLTSKTIFLEAQVNSTIDGILVVDGNNRKILQNQRFIDLFHLPADIVENPDDAVALKHVLGKVAEPKLFLQKVKYLYEHCDEVSRDEIQLKDGTVLDRYSSPVVGADGSYYGRIWTFHDITDRKLAEERVQFLAYYDALTGLPNRSLLQDRLAKALASARRRKEKLALLFLDLDRFKIINDSLGHSVGDLLLQEVGERLKKWAREQDTVARVGGDEFLIVLTGVKEVGDAAVSAERVINSLRKEFLLQGHTLSISSSIGISVFPEHGEDAETLIKNADAAMYSAKDGGRSNFRFFTEDMNSQVVERLNLESSLRPALDRGELFVLYQPQIDIASEKIVGLEALLRWRHPTLGLVSPGKFIRVAENSGLIIPIGEWVLRTACRQAREWQEQGLPALPVAVNVSAVQFRQEGFSELIRKVLRETGLEPQYLELELTESLLISNEGLTLSVLRELSAMGVKLSIDDFGTGYSSLSYLRTFPVHKLKIDRSFIRDMAVKADDAAIAIAIISLAKSMNLKVIAEGVENEAQVSFLRSHHCDEIQGYYFCKPVTADEIVDKLSVYSESAFAGK